MSTPSTASLHKAAQAWCKPETEKIEMDSRLATAFAEILDQVARQIDENHVLQLAAISTATIQNTRKTIADRAGRDNPYCTQAYLDVCAAIDRDILHREQKLALEDQAEAYLLDRNNLAAQLGVARVALDRISRQLDACPFVTAEEALAALPGAAQNLSAQKPIAR